MAYTSLPVTSIRRPSGRRAFLTLGGARQVGLEDVVTGLATVVDAIDLEVEVGAGSAAVATSSLIAERVIEATMASVANVASSMVASRLLDAEMASGATLTTTIDAAAQYAITLATQITAISVMASTQIAGNERRIPVRQGNDTWVVNLETSASSQYDNYGFESFANTSMGPLAVAEDGLYLLDGDTDAGGLIPAFVELPKNDFSSQDQKRIENVFIGVAAADPLDVSVSVDGDTTYTYTAVSSDDDLRVQRAKLGRGLRGNFWKLRLSASTAFELESVEVSVASAGRKTK